MSKQRCATGWESDEDPQRPLSLSDWVQKTLSVLKIKARKKLSYCSDFESLNSDGVVTEVYLRLRGNSEQEPTWDNKRHFLNAAIKAMKHLLIDRWIRRQRKKHGGGVIRKDLNDDAIKWCDPAIDRLELDEALERLEEKEPKYAAVIRLRRQNYTMKEVEEQLGISEIAAQRCNRRGEEMLKKLMTPR